MKVVKVLCLVSTVFAICGCTPEETFVVVNASALKKAVSGELANAKVEMVFDIQDKSDPDLPNKIRKAALPYLGEGAVVELEKTEKRKIRTGVASGTMIAKLKWTRVLMVQNLLHAFPFLLEWKKF